MTQALPDLAPAVPQYNPDFHRRVGDAVVACLLVVAQLILFSGAFILTGFMAMGTDSCAYRACGDPAWIGWAIALAVLGGGALVLGSAVATLRQIVRDRVAWFVPLIGCLAQVGIVIACAAMAMQAGPITN